MGYLPNFGRYLPDSVLFFLWYFLYKKCLIVVLLTDRVSISYGCTHRETRCFHSAITELDAEWLTSSCLRISSIFPIAGKKMWLFDTLHCFMFSICKNTSDRWYIGVCGDFESEFEKLYLPRAFASSACLCVCVCGVCVATSLLKRLAVRHCVIL